MQRFGQRRVFQEVGISLYEQPRADGIKARFKGEVGRIGWRGGGEHRSVGAHAERHGVREQRSLALRYLNGSQSLRDVFGQFFIEAEAGSATGWDRQDLYSL